MNYLIYPTKVMNITQNYSDVYSHAPHTTGFPADYPIDENMAVSGEGEFFCPCDEMVVKRVYPSPITDPGTNTIWLESTSPVVTPTFTDYVTILFMHMNEWNLKDIKVGKKYTRKQYISKSGTSGKVTGNHVHMSVSRGKYVEAGWTLNTKDMWVITGNPQKPENSFYVDKTFTTISNARGLSFKDMPTVTLPTPVPRNESVLQIEVIVDQLRARISPEINNSNIIGFVSKGIYNVIQWRENAGYTWYEVEKDKWLATDGTWLKVYEPKKPYEDIKKMLNEAIALNNTSTDLINKCIKELN